MVVDLSEAEWQQVLNMISLAPWRDANPLLMKIGAQLRDHTPPSVEQPPAHGIRLDANGKEIGHE